MLIPKVMRAWFRHIIACMGFDILFLKFSLKTPAEPVLSVPNRGCLGGCAKPTPIIAVDEPSKRLKVQGRNLKGPNFSEDFWSSSTNEMDNSTVQSQRSLSSISTSNQNSDSRAANTNTNNTEFVNNALILWNEMRQQWVGDRPRNQPRQLREPVLSWNTTYESLLGTNRPFPQLIPLSEMVEFLVDVWEQEGLYD